MKERNLAVSIVKSVIAENSSLRIGIGDGYILFWKKGILNTTPEEWKHIGYASALVYIFKIREDEVGLDTPPGFKETEFYKKYKELYTYDMNRFKGIKDISDIT